MSVMPLPRWTVGFLAAALAGGCAEVGGQSRLPGWAVDVPDGTQIALRGPGSRSVLLAVRPPHAVGPNTHMVLRKGRLSGQHRGSGFVLQIAPGSISGTGTGGPVEMEVWGDAYEIRAEGTWNGSVGRFRLDPEGLRVSAASSAGQVVCGRPIPPRYFSAYFRRTSGGDLVQVQGPHRRQDYALEVGSKLSTWLSREEIVALLMITLSGPGRSTTIDPIACGPFTSRPFYY
jgi:hypothetical protein